MSADLWFRFTRPPPPSERLSRLRALAQIPIGHALYASDVIESVNAAQRECEKLSEAHLANDLSAVQMACAEIDRLTRHASEIAKAYGHRIAQHRSRQPRVR